MLQQQWQTLLCTIYKESSCRRRTNKLRFEFEKTGKEKFGAGGIGRLYINNDKVGEAEIPHTVRFIYELDETFDIGGDTGTPVTDERQGWRSIHGNNQKSCDRSGW